MSGIISLKKINSFIHSTRWRILLAYLLVICVAFTIVDFTLIQLIGEYLFTQRSREEERLSQDVAARVASSYAQHDAGTLYALSREFALDNDARVLVTDHYGIVQADSESELNGTLLAWQEVAEVLQGSESAYGYYDDSSLSIYLLAMGRTGATGIHTVSINGGALVYVSSAQEIYQSMSTIQTRILTWLVLVAIIVLVIVYIISDTFTKPVKEFSRAINRMARGDMKTKVHIRGKNEFARLGNAFNSMSEQLERLNDTRNEFVSNASHELKTPLSTIKILVETLLYQDPVDPGMTREFLGDINREIDRMNTLVGDLLSLVRIDSGGLKLNKTDVVLGVLVNDTVKRIKPVAQDKSITVRCDIWEDAHCYGDQIKLGQVIYNLLDNAVKYTPGGGAVRIELSKNGKKAVIIVTDNGIGIPAKDMPHIFERFYRVDKARSRETGGTGLGLAIVKQIVELHGGEISFTSEEGVGTVFTVELPVK